MQDAVRSKKIAILPSRFEKIYFNWIDNLRDWCISRQLWYGHQIPVWYRNDEIYCGVIVPDSEGWQQDPDTLDTWFSSGLWTFSTLGWPNKTDDLATYHPTAVLETGHDIIFFWVARMILMSTYLLNEVPFKTVYLHGLVRDEKGRKMSKSLGNIIDPLDVTNKYGTDAVRLSLVIGSTPGNDVKLSEEKIASYRNFTNKLWNISRYVLANTTDKKLPLRPLFKTYTSADSWILEHMSGLIVDVTDDINNCRFSQAGERLRDFTWSKFADWYVEAAKVEDNEVKDGILRHVLEGLLKLWHPFMPFVTEVIWREMGHDTMLLVAPWPHEVEYAGYSEGEGYQGRGRMSFDTVKNIITAIRSIRSDYGIAPKQKIKAVIYAGDKVELLESQKTLIESLRTGVDVTIHKTGDTMKEVAYAVVDGVEVYIPLAGLVDITKEKVRLEKRSQELKKVITATDAKLGNEAFVHHAPADIVQAEIDKAEGYQQELKKIKAQIKHL